MRVEAERAVFVQPGEEKGPGGCYCGLQLLNGGCRVLVELDLSQRYTAIGQQPTGWNIGNSNSM